ncbi:MAG TPA: TetR/AcrR family transcriptional regulator [Solirubrobacteraceae bacterium]|jgi:AcrR family transcriptional regulator|nr:TetR/AcrR family transcriptional regulator [Solirubrobacteraceae bacterium]
MSTTEHGWRRPSAGGITPLYKRLPKGPHGIAPEDVVHHQRIRMHGAMIEAVALHGYERTSVKHVIGLAGVSRRAFYEQFANKEDCFMETFDLIVNRTVRRVSSACRAGDGSLEKRARAGLRALVEELETNPKALHLVLIDALTAGPEGQLRLRRALAASEQLLAGSFQSSPQQSTLQQSPGPLVRAVVGGLRRVVFSRLRDGRLENRSVLSGEMLRWTLLFAAPAVQELQLRPSSKPPPPRIVQMRPYSLHAGSDYDRLLLSVVNLVLREPYEELSAPHIAEEAGLSIDTFLDLFESPRECFVAALDMLGGDLLEEVADPALVSSQWPLAVCDAVERLTAHLVERPASTVTLAAKTFGAGISVIEDMVTLADEVTTLLTEGAPRRPGSRLAPEWISGALAHTLHTEVLAGRAHLLGTLTEYISYAILAPYIGPEQAVQTIVKARENTALGNSRAVGTLAQQSAAPSVELGEVREDDADEQGDHDHDDQRSLA